MLGLPDDVRAFYTVAAVTTAKAVESHIEMLAGIQRRSECVPN